jgi:hypothetical protein
VDLVHEFVCGPQEIHVWDHVDYDPQLYGAGGGDVLPREFIFGLADIHKTLKHRQVALTGD